VGPRYDLGGDGVRNDHRLTIEARPGTRLLGGETTRSEDEIRMLKGDADHWPQRSPHLFPVAPHSDRRTCEATGRDRNWRKMRMTRDDDQATAPSAREPDRGDGKPCLVHQRDRAMLG
jgi:hypothetical protein